GLAPRPGRRRPTSPAVGPVSAEMPLEEIDRPLPRERRGLLVETRRRIVVEAVVRAGIEVRLVLDPGVVQRRLISRPARVDPLVRFRVVQEQGRADRGHLLDGGLSAVERDARGEIGAPHRELVDHAAAEAEADGADAAVARLRALQPLERRDEILDETLAIELGEELPGPILVARIAAE